jgi:hypothetical protein
LKSSGRIFVLPSSCFAFAGSAILRTKLPQLEASGGVVPAGSQPLAGCLASPKAASMVTRRSIASDIAWRSRGSEVSALAGLKPRKVIWGVGSLW